MSHDLQQCIALDALEMLVPSIDVRIGGGLLFLGADHPVPWRRLHSHGRTLDITPHNHLGDLLLNCTHSKRRDDR